MLGLDNNVYVLLFIMGEEFLVEYVCLSFIGLILSFTIPYWEDMYTSLSFV